MDETARVAVAQAAPKGACVSARGEAGGRSKGHLLPDHAGRLCPAFPPSCPCVRYAFLEEPDLRKALREGDGATESLLQEIAEALMTARRLRVRSGVRSPHG